LEVYREAMKELPHHLTPEMLAAHAGFVRTLARRLVADENRADDVEQQT
jgi:hypothetical protein